MTPCVVGIDCSTTACKAIAFDAEGNVLAEGRAALDLHNPEPDGWEQDARQWWSALGEASRALGIDAASVQAVCVTHQRETYVLVDADGEPIAPAWVWMDKRCAADLEALSIDREAVARTTGKPVCTTPSVYKLRTQLARDPSLRPRAAAVLDVHGFLARQLTGGWHTSVAAADPMGLVDLERGVWADAVIAELLGDWDVIWPELHRSGAPLATLSAAAAGHLGLPPGLAVVAGAGDGQCAALGAGVVPSRPTRAYLNLGTAIVGGLASARYRTAPAFRTLAGAGEGFLLETDLQGGTFTLNWLTGSLLGADDPAARRAELEAEAAGLPAGADGLLLVPYWNGVMNPLWDDRATGMVAGLHGGHGPAHVYRAILEGIALEQRWHFEGVASAAGTIESVVVVGGGSKSDLWCQIVSDVLGLPVTRARTDEATALGAAILAAVPALHPDLDTAVAAMTGDGRRFDPRPAHRAFYDRVFREVYRGLYEAIQPRMRALSLLRAEAPVA